MRARLVGWGLLLASVMAGGYFGCKSKRTATPPTPAVSAVPFRVTPVTPAVLSPFERWPEGAVYDRDPEHAYNRSFRALYARKIEGSISRCLVDADAGSCMATSATTPFSGAMVKAEIELGADELSLFAGNDVEFLGEPARVDRIEAAADAAASVSPAENPARTALLVNDLWERFDSIGRVLKNESAPNRANLERVRKRIKALMVTLALPAETLRAIGSNRAEIAAANPDLLPGFETEQGWLEVRSRFTDSPGEAKRVGTRHAEQLGRRAVFRVLVRVPAEAGGSDWLRERIAAGSAPELPPGTRLALVGSPLAVAKRGEIVALGLIELVEIRAVRPLGAPATTLTDVGFDVLEGKRALMVRSPRPRGGLERLAIDAPVPFGATCAAQVNMRVPMRSTCVTCHGPRGNRVTGPMAHGALSFEEERDPNAAAEIVIREKRADPGFAELVAGYPGD